MDAALAGLIGAGIGVLGSLVPTVMSYKLERKRYDDEKNLREAEAAAAPQRARTAAYDALLGALATRAVERSAKNAADVQRAAYAVFTHGSIAARTVLIQHQAIIAGAAYNEGLQAMSTVLADFLSVVQAETHTNEDVVV